MHVFQKIHRKKADSHETHTGGHFRYDGTLIDSREYIYQAMEDVLEQFGVIDVTREDVSAVAGKPIQAMYALLAPGKDAIAMERAHLEHHRAHAHLLLSYDYVHEVLQGLQKQGIKLGVFTGFDKQTYGRLEQFHMLSYFDSIVESTMYTKHKPDPEGLLVGMMDLGVSPQATIYVGDGINDVLAGKNAGVAHVIAMTHGFGGRQTLEEAGADYLVDSFKDLKMTLKKLGYGS